MKVLRPVTPKEFSALVGGLVTPDTVREWCRRGKLKTVPGHRHPYLIPWAEAERFIPEPTVYRRFLVCV